jgi:GNAT superfamily N-acetyltransferase
MVIPARKLTYNWRPAAGPGVRGSRAGGGAGSHKLRRVKETVTHVEMTAASQLVPADPVPGLTLEPVDRDSPVVPGIMARTGAAYRWKSASRTEDEWAAWFAEHPGLSFWLLSFEGEPAGIVCCDLQPGGEAQIVTFGLLPEFVGQGLGGFALTLAVRQAWALAPSVNRVWLHTSTLDHPRALPNYHRRGFRTFKTEQFEPG